MREIVLDTETTGLSPADGHRIIEIGCVELYNHVATGAVFQTYINPERSVPEEARRVHGIDDAMLADKPLFSDIVESFLGFLSDSPLVIHNAEFDLRFLNAELARLERPPLARDRAVDTVTMARQKFFGAGASLDALCRRFGIDLSGRDLHGALKDAQLLAEVYLQLRGGRQPDLRLVRAAATRRTAGVKVVRTPVVIPANEDESRAHDACIDKLTDPLWRQTLS
ncbi:MAG: DNA polymerase III subunit epsilon [Rhodospirillales bacterium]|nr:MAG: DNA polymerase III subunit epsilon [Rhodospirillales bacterium]